MSEQRGHGPTEQREWGEGWPRTVCADEGHRTELDVLRNRCEDCGGSFTELVPLSAAEAALSRVEAERDELAAHLERVREWAEAMVDGGSHGNGEPGYGRAMVDLGAECLSLLPDPKGER